MWKVELMVLISVVTAYGIAELSDKNNTLWDYTASPEEVRNSHIELMKLYMNTSMDPCYDFYEYSCGNWKNANELHSEIKTVGEVLFEKIKQVLSQIIQDSSEDDTNNAPAFTLLYKSCINKDLISERGSQPAIDFLKKFDGWPMVHSNSSNEYVDWLKLSAELALYGKQYVLSAYVDEDAYSIIIEPSFPYNIYRKEIKNVTKFIMGEALDDNILDEIIAFEKSFRSALGNYYEEKSKLTLAELLIEEPHIDWERYLSIFLQKPMHSNQKVKAHVTSLKEIGTLLSNTSSRIIANYMLCKVILDMVYEFVNINAEDEKSLTRKEYCVAQTQSYLSKSLSKAFVDKYFDENANERAKQLSEEIRETFSEFIGNIFWIDEQTKEIAKEKVNSIKLKVGYTAEDFQNNVDNLILKSDEFFENSIKLRQHKVKTKWLMTEEEKKDISRYIAQYDMAAFYMRKENTTENVYITAGMLQPPLFNNYIPNWSNYGGIGYIIGHELTHGFNTRFIKARENTTDSEWWSPESFKEYMIRILCYNFQYNKYEHDEQQISVDGQKTLAENMADNGGLKFGYDAYNKWLKNHVDSEENEVNPVINLSGKQLYFVSFAQTLCNYNDDYDYDHHTHPTFRVIGSISNSFDFARAFQCPIGSRMNPPRKCRF